MDWESKLMLWQALVSTIHHLNSLVHIFVDEVTKAVKRLLTIASTRQIANTSLAGDVEEASGVTISS